MIYIFTPPTNTITITMGEGVMIRRGDRVDVDLEVVPKNVREFMIPVKQLPQDAKRAGRPKGSKNRPKG